MRQKNILWTAIFLVICSLCAVIILFRYKTADEAKTAVIYIGNEVVRTVDLSYVPEAYEFDISGENGTNRIRVEQGRIRVVYADCPDNVCVDQGWINSTYAPIVCLPHKMTVEIKSDAAEDNEYDAVVGGAGYSEDE